MRQPKPQGLKKEKEKKDTIIEGNSKNQSVALVFTPLLQGQTVCYER